MNWDALDFAVFAALLLGIGITFSLAVRTSKNTAFRSATAVALTAAFILVWINGAVGIIGNENNDANLMFVGILAIAIVGAAIARFRPMGMARTLTATALGQWFVAAIALVGDLGSGGPAWPWDILVLTAVFSVLWLISARLFRYAARRPISARTDPEE